MLLPAVLGAFFGASCLFIAWFVIDKVVPVLVGCYRAKQQFTSSPIPGPPLPSQFLGHIKYFGPGYGKGPWRMLEWAETYGPLFKLQFLHHFAVVLSDPQTIARVTRKTGPGPYLPKPHELYQVIEDVVSPRRPNIVASVDNAYWKSVRQATAPCFSMSNLKQVVPLAVKLTQRVAERMAGCDVFDMTDGAKRITSDIMGHLLFGEDLGGTRWEPSLYLDVFTAVLQDQAAKVDNPFHELMVWRPEVRHQRRCVAIHNRLMADKVARLRRHPPEEHTIAAHILSAVDPATGKPLDDYQVKAEVATFMAAGFETTSHAITWCFTLLAMFPEVQQEVFEELQAAGLAAADAGVCSTNAVSGRDFEASDLGRLPVLSAVIKESLRICSPAPYGTIRQVESKEGADMCGYNVPQGTIVFIPTLPFGLASSNYGTHALDFDHHRWLDAPGATHSANTAGGNGHEAVLEPMTFLVGPRDCIGQNLAKLELQVVVATLLSRFRFSPAPDLARELDLAAATGRPPVTAVHAMTAVHGTLQPASGHMMLRVTSRR